MAKTSEESEFTGAKAIGRFGDEKMLWVQKRKRDGFWIHRCLVSDGIEKIVIAAASIQVNRKKRQAKTDRIDAEKMVLALIHYRMGDHYALRAVRVPDHVAEDARHLNQEMRTIKTEKTAHTNRIGSLLGFDWLDSATFGAPISPKRKRVGTLHGNSLACASCLFSRSSVPKWRCPTSNVTGLYVKPRNG